MHKYCLSLDTKINIIPLNYKTIMKIVVTGTRGIPNIMGGVETHCEELFPRIAKRGFDVTVIYAGRIMSRTT